MNIFPIQYVAAWLAAAVLAGCRAVLSRKEERYVLIAANINLPYWQRPAAGLRA